MNKFFKRLKYALQGLLSVAKHEMNFRIQLLGALIVIVLVILVPLDMWERILMIVMTAAVLVLEVINSIFERIADALKPRLSPVVREVKDMMAGAVLLTAVTAVVVAVLIFWEYVGRLVA